MNAGRVSCPGCRAPVPELNADEFYSCPHCEAQLQVHPFPALSHSPASSPSMPALSAAGEATCFYHPQKKAVIACESCGRFLCALCDIEIGTEHRCPACLEAARRSRCPDALENRVTRWDRVALGLTTITVLVWPLMIVAAPAALFIVIRYWNKRSVILPASRSGYVIAGLLALGEIAGFIAIGYAIFAHHSHA